MTRPTNPFPYPYLVCRVHGDLPVAPGWAVCNHVILGTGKIGHVALANPTTLGEVLCEGCAQKPPPVKELKLYCLYCLRNLCGGGLLPWEIH